ncbi:oxidoreductase-like protein [Stagonosporopsis vannaccii]|nr:oxidoreductase-like protein [Stagonosporopsis vannaccii]
MVSTGCPLALRRYVCASCAKPWNRARIGMQNSSWIQRRYKYYIAPEGEQARPITGYYAEMLKKQPPQAPTISNDTSSYTAPAAPPKSTSTDPPKTQKEITLERARTVFGSKPGVRERRLEIDAASTEVAGIRVPPKPAEPDNCCMSGCVNCVWDMYRDEMEEWAEQSAKARAAIQAKREASEGDGSILAEQKAPSHVAVSMDDDGGGSETNWTGSAGEGKLFDDIPVGIREFMKTEKKLKQRHKAEEIPT